MRTTTALLAGSILLSLTLVGGCEATTGTLLDEPGIGEPDGSEDPGARPGDPVVDPTCDEQLPIQIIEAEPPDLLLVVDKSGSMRDELSNGQDKWPIMRSALTSIVNTHDEGIRFGLMTYPQGDECVAGAVGTAIADSTSTAIAGTLNGINPDGGTPTHTTLTGALDYYKSIEANINGQYVLLATDGLPNCGPGDSRDPMVNESIAAVSALADAGIPTFVLGFGSVGNNDPTVLQSMAVAGGTDAFYAANSPAELQAALEAIAGEVTLPSCNFALSAAPADDSKLDVLFDDRKVARDALDGWDYDPAQNTITLFGAACTELQSGTVSSVNIDFGCGDGGVVVL